MVDRYGNFLIVRVDDDGGSTSDKFVRKLSEKIALDVPGVERVYALLAPPHRGKGAAAPRRPELIFPVGCDDDPNEFEGIENGVIHNLTIGGGSFSTGLFLDQRDLRAWMKREFSVVENDRMLNLFAHAGSFGRAVWENMEVTNVDLSKGWLDRFDVQGGGGGGHRNLKGDVFEWLGRLKRRGETFDVVVVDPPSTSIGTKKKRFSVNKDFGMLVRQSVHLVSPKGGWLILITNLRSMKQERFVEICEEGVRAGGRRGTSVALARPQMDFQMGSEKGEMDVKTLIVKVQKI